MDNDLYAVQQVPSARLKGIHLDILSDEDAKKLCAMVIESANEVSDAALGLPVLNSPQCLTCGAQSSKHGQISSNSCEGHFGLINLRCTVLNPYFMPEIAQILNKICPACKSVRGNKLKRVDSRPNQHDICKYCTGSQKNGYPKMKFKVASKEVLAKTAITAEVDEVALNRRFNKTLASDYWDVIPKDSSQEDNILQSNKRVLWPAQVYCILKDVCPKILQELFRRNNSIFLNYIPVTPNSHRVREFGHRITFDERTRMYKRIVDHRGTPNELSARIIELYKSSKIRSENLTHMQQVYEKQSNNDSASSSSGLKNIRELVIAKRTDHSFRMVVVGDPSIKVDEIGVPTQIAAEMLVSDHLHEWNWNKLEACCDFMLSQGGKFSVSRKGQRISVGSKDMLRVGDAIKRPLIDGDIILCNRPPSIHQHSLLALYVKILPENPVFSINPLICSPLRGDFDGDCLHGFVPQSVNSKVELKELVSLDKQLFNGQSGQNLLSLGQDSLTAAYLIVEDGVVFKKPEMQQLQMCLPELPSVMPFQETEITGKQLFGMLLPLDFEFSYEVNDVCIRQRELSMSSHGVSWLRDNGENLFQCLNKHCPEKALDILYATQDILCQWLTKRGLSVSLSDLCLTSDPESQTNLLEDRSIGLQQADMLFDISLLMVGHIQRSLVESSEDEVDILNNLKELLHNAHQTSAELCLTSFSATKSVLRDLQNLVYQYAEKDNSFMAMLKSGSKGNLQKFSQHSICLGMQHSSTPLSFSIPRNLSCASWNNHKNHISYYKSDGARDSYIPCTLVASSYLTGLNPFECYVHSLTSRDSSFSGQADVAGTINKRLMYFMRDLMIEYDGTVRNAYGNQVVQFSYSSEDEDNSAASKNVFIGGDPVGALAACALTEVAYSALDQPLSAVEASPLMELKTILECGVKRNTGAKTASLFLTRKLGRWINGFEYGALQVKDHLESVLFTDIVSEVLISHGVSGKKIRYATPWICHFHISKEAAKKQRLKIESIINALHMNCNSTGVKKKVLLPKLLIESNPCFEADCASKICITAAVSHYTLSDLDPKSKNQFTNLEYHRNIVIPVLRQTVIKGFPEFKKVDILWKDEPNSSKAPKCSSGELFLRVHMSDHCARNRFWGILKDKCLKINNVIDWQRSIPDNINDVTEAYGIDVAWQCFVNKLNSAVSDTGKNILQEHVKVTADCLSMTGEFVPLNANGLAQQRKAANASSPFMQACFAKPFDTICKAAKMGQTDLLQGSVEALAWGQTPPIGTGSNFEILYSGKGHEPEKPTDVYSLLSSHVGVSKPNERKKFKVKVEPYNSEPQFMKINGRKLYLNGLIKFNAALDEVNRSQRALRKILQEYEIGSTLSAEDKITAIGAMQYHPRWKKKSGTGDIEIKVGHHPDHEDSRCFFVVREDGTEEDISYHKSIHQALSIINSHKAKEYHSTWLSSKEKRFNK